ncbi:MAG: AraC family transcriptional regulator [Bacteroidota bacterium]
MLHLKEGTYFGENVKADENELIKLSITSYHNKSTLEKHYHDNSYISILTSGKYLEQSGSTSSLVNVTDVLFRPASYCHQNSFLSESSTCFNIEFKKGWEEQLELKLNLPNKHAHYRISAFPSLYKLLLNFKTNNLNSDLSTELIADWICSINKAKHHGRKSWVSKIEAILKHELSQFHSLKSLAERIHVHPVYMARVFKEVTGFTIGEYQLIVKLHHSVFQLSSTSQSISDISFTNGFYDDAHFIKSFKLKYGISPQKFRTAVNS